MSMIKCSKCGSLVDTDYNVEHTEEEDGYCENEFQRGYQAGLEEGREEVTDLIRSKKLPLQPEIVPGANYLVENYNAVLDEIINELIKN